MKEYPSITLVKPGSPPDETLYTFDKIDGSNIRIEWSKKRGWWKFASRTRLFDETDDLLGPASDIFKRSSADPLAKYFLDQRQQSAIVFAEYHGTRSFAGLHHTEDCKSVTIIDLATKEGGILDPRDFLKMIDKTAGNVGTPRYLGHVKWNETFLRTVDGSNFVGMTFEGVVGKVMKNKRLFMWKAKTEQWRQAVREKFDHVMALGLIDS